jgi:hypothetical protein
MQLKTSNQSSQYRIVIQGDLNSSWLEWFGEGSFDRIYQDRSSRETVIISAIPDQAALRGLVNRMWDLNLTLNSVNIQELDVDGGKRE